MKKKESISTGFVNKKCIVLGADGYLGRHLVRSIFGSGNAVTSFGSTTAGFRSNEQLQVVDITCDSSLLNIDWNVDLIFMFAGLTGTHAGFDRAANFLQVNEIGLVNVLEAIRRSGFRPRVVFPSTRLVYQGSDSPLSEEAHCQPKTVYAVNKISCENLLSVYSNSFNINFTVYRIGVPYGAVIGNTYSYGTLGTFIQHAINKRVIRLYGDGSLRRTFTHVEDLCDQILKTCTHEMSLNQIYNTLGEDISLVQVAAAIANKFGAALEFAPFPEKDLLIETGHTVFDSTKLEKHFGLNLKNTMMAWLDNIDIESNQA